MPNPARVVSGRRHHRLRMLASSHFACRGWNVGGIALGAKRCEHTRSGTVNHQTALGTFLKSVKERALHLVEDVEVDGALVAYSNDCFVQGVQHHHGSQLLAAVMDRWPSFSRFESEENFLRFHRSH